MSRVVLRTERYDGVVFVYERNLEHQCWLLKETIYSPLASGPNRTISQGFGYRVGLSKNFLIASTSVNNGTRYGLCSSDLTSVEMKTELHLHHS